MMLGAFSCFVLTCLATHVYTLALCHGQGFWHHQGSQESSLVFFKIHQQPFKTSLHGTRDDHHSGP